MYQIYVLLNDFPLGLDICCLPVHSPFLADGRRLTLQRVIPSHVENCGVGIKQPFLLNLSWNGRIRNTHMT